MRKKKIYLFLVCLAVCFWAGLALGLSENKNRVCFGGNCFEVEIARSDKQRTQGLMFRDYLARDKGMLFVFDKEDIYGFWMKNTKIPLDIIWLDSEKKVVFMVQDAQPCREDLCSPFFPDKPALYVLEINAGTAGILGLRNGDRAEFDI